MKLGVFSVSLPEYDPEESLKVLKELGYDAVEWRVTDPAPASKDPEKKVPFEFRYWGDNKSTIPLSTIEEQAPALKEMADKYGIEIVSLTTYLAPKELEKIESVLRAAASIGVPKIRVFQDSYPAKGEAVNYRVAMNETRVLLAKLELMARKYGVKVLLETHHGTLVSSASAAYNLLAGFDPNCIGVIFDPGNMVIEGYENYAKSFELLGAYIGHVHIKNCKMVEDGRDQFGSLKWKMVQTPLWDGTADLRELFRVMKENGYDDTVSIEDFSNEDSTYDKLKHNIEYVHRITADFY